MFKRASLYQNREQEKLLHTGDLVLLEDLRLITDTVEKAVFTVRVPEPRGNRTVTGTIFLVRWGNNRRGFLTNHHVISFTDREPIQDGTVIEAARDPTGDDCPGSVSITLGGSLAVKEVNGYRINCNEEQIPYAFCCEMLDATYLELSSEFVERFEKMGACFLDVEEDTRFVANLKHSVTIYQHPGGSEKIKFDQGEIVELATPVMRYKVNTMAGSSGSPILNSRGKVIGLHHSAGDQRLEYNCGTDITWICKAVNIDRRNATALECYPLKPTFPNDAEGLASVLNDPTGFLALIEDFEMSVDRFRLNGAELYTCQSKRSSTSPRLTVAVTHHQCFFSVVDPVAVVGVMSPYVVINWIPFSASRARIYLQLMEKLPLLYVLQMHNIDRLFLALLHNNLFFKEEVSPDMIQHEALFVKLLSQKVCRRDGMVHLARTIIAMKWPNVVKNSIKALTSVPIVRNCKRSRCDLSDQKDELILEELILKFLRDCGDAVPFDDTRKKSSSFSQQEVVLPESKTSAAWNEISRPNKPLRRLESIMQSHRHWLFRRSAAFKIFSVIAAVIIALLIIASAVWIFSGKTFGRKKYQTCVLLIGGAELSHDEGVPPTEYYHPTKQCKMDSASPDFLQSAQNIKTTSGCFLLKERKLTIRESVDPNTSPVVYSFNDERVYYPSLPYKSQSTGKQRHTSRTASTTIGDGHTCLSCGGTDGIDGISIDRCYRFDPASDQWVDDVGRLPYNVSRAAVVALSQSYYVIGGETDSQPSGSNKVVRYDVRQKKWSEKVSGMRVGRYGHAAAVISETEFIVCGGIVNTHSDDSGSGRSCEIYNAQSNIWRKAASMNIARFWFAMVVIDDAVYALGGYANDDKSTNEVEVYDAKADKWNSAPPLKNARSDFVAVVGSLSEK